MDVDRLYHRHAQRLFGFLAYRTGDRLLAEDLVGDVFERALRAQRRFDPRRGSEEAWLFAIAVNLLRDHARRASAEQRALQRLGRPVEATAAQDDAVARRDEVLSALRGLSDEERETVALRFGADLTIAQIARATGERETTIDGRLRRGLRRLREQLDDADAGEASAVSPR
jgi:RNA polymerase sigma factor (sigma-70 family)